MKEMVQGRSTKPLYLQGGFCEHRGNNGETVLAIIVAIGGAK